MYDYIESFFTALNENVHPGDIAHAIALAFLLAFIPNNNLLWMLIFFITVFVRIHKGSFFLVLILLSFVVPFADVLIEQIGYVVLSLSFMEGIYTFLYQTPFIGLTNFNNTMVTGGLILGLITYIPVYLGVRAFIPYYRKDLYPKIIDSKLVKAFYKIPLIQKIINTPDPRGFIK